MGKELNRNSTVNNYFLLKTILNSLYTNFAAKKSGALFTELGHNSTTSNPTTFF
jgi:hypothetical protein